MSMMHAYWYQTVTWNKVLGTDIPFLSSSYSVQKNFVMWHLNFDLISENEMIISYYFDMQTHLIGEI